MGKIDNKVIINILDSLVTEIYDEYKIRVKVDDLITKLMEQGKTKLLNDIRSSIVILRGLKGYEVREYFRGAITSLKSVEESFTYEAEDVSESYLEEIKLAKTSYDLDDLGLYELPYIYKELVEFVVNLIVGRQIGYEVGIPDTINNKVKDYVKGSISEDKLNEITNKISVYITSIHRVSTSDTKLVEITLDGYSEDSLNKILKSEIYSLNWKHQYTKLSEDDYKRMQRYHHLILTDEIIGKYIQEDYIDYNGTKIPLFKIHIGEHIIVMQPSKIKVHHVKNMKVLTVLYIDEEGIGAIDKVLIKELLNYMKNVKINGELQKYILYSIYGFIYSMDLRKTDNTVSKSLIEIKKKVFI